MEAKKMGFSDVQIANCTNINEIEVRALRKKLMVQPVTKQIDTLAAEWPAKTNYLYLTYGGEFNDVKCVSRRNVRKLISDKRTPKPRIRRYTFKGDCPRRWAIQDRK